MGSTSSPSGPRSEDPSPDPWELDTHYWVQRDCWDCKGCGSMNLCFKSCCTCGGRREILQEQHEGGWVCNVCGNLNPHVRRWCIWYDCRNAAMGMLPVSVCAIATLASIHVHGDEVPGPRSKADMACALVLVLHGTCVRGRFVPGPGTHHVPWTWMHSPMCIPTLLQVLGRHVTTGLGLRAMFAMTLAVCNQRSQS